MIGNKGYWKNHEDVGLLEIVDITKNRSMKEEYRVFKTVDSNGRTRNIQEEWFIIYDAASENIKVYFDEDYW